MALIAGGAGAEFVAAVVVGMVGVAFGPAPVGRVAADLKIQRLPKISIDHGRFVSFHPTSLLPPMNPLRDAVFHVF